MKAIINLCGPTAAGKSALALELARLFNGVIINADSMQIYQNLAILTAQPKSIEYLQQEHLLYNFLSPTKTFSTGAYLRLVKQQIDLVHQQNKIPIIVGGTGLYFKSLVYGFLEVPNIAKEINQQAFELFNQLGNCQFYQLLKDKDPEGAIKLNINDRQRLIRAYSVIEQTGISISKWQQNSIQTYSLHQFLQIGLFPNRDMLYQNCNDRFTLMLESGVIQEVEALNTITIDDQLTARKAHGVTAITNYLRGIINKEEAIELTKRQTRNYAKRQLTWFRHQLPDLIKLDYQHIHEIESKIYQLVEQHINNLNQ